MLLVVGAQTAIIGTAMFGAALELERAVPRFDVVLAELVIGSIARDQCLPNTVAMAALEIIDAVVLDDDLGRHQREAGFA